MSNDVTIYHNPRCSKSRQTLQLLRDRGVDPRVVLYLNDPLTTEALRALITALGLSSPHEILRTKEPAYKDAGLSESSTQEQVINAILADPILLERPIVLRGSKAVLGRPPENVLTVL